ncbi:hypothetical protein [Variovorax sp. Sphag1AA]|uniref:hypothetical protein n=1 Tax=Variovorax sp. Sphag1AA TaxID=2587027 RepID=UPI001616F0C1|nr:hypothetical protein [Variovorax sp. Sphag1AA]MBB3179741.1 hypothetical protein [Variovorax sp. Sphag1AA]
MKLQINPRLSAAINAACRARGESELQRLALLAEAAEVPVEWHDDLAEHFELEARGSSGQALSTGNSSRALGLFTEVAKGVK